MYANLSAKELLYEVPIEEFLRQRVKLEAEYMEALEIDQRGRLTAAENY